MNNHPNAPTHGSKPFLKWVGGKQRLLPQLLPLLPPGKRLIEPFVGAGSVFLRSSYPRYLINDANPDLVAVWTALKQRPREFIQRSSDYFSEQYLGQDAYLQVRAEFNAEVDRFERAVRFIYLNKTCFNGLFRVNRSGAFNVPYGQSKTLPWFPAEELANASQKMANVTVMGGDFSAAIAEAGEGDVVYCDPPYLPDSARKTGFSRYTVGGFGIEEHARLVLACGQAYLRGATVLISNSDVLEARFLYSGWQLHELSVRRSVSADKELRGAVRELLAVRVSP